MQKWLEVGAETNRTCVEEPAVRCNTVNFAEMLCYNWQFRAHNFSRIVGTI